MLEKWISATAASLMVFAEPLGGAQPPTGGWDLPHEARPVLAIRGDASGSVELRQDEYVGLVIAPTFRSAEDLCASSVQIGLSPANVNHGAATWHIEGRLVDLREGEATIDFRWMRRINRGDLTPADSITTEQRLVLREGDPRVLDVVRTNRRPATGCDSFALTYELQLAGPRALANAAIAYDLWLVQRDADGELLTDRYQVTAKQGQQVEYFFRPVPYTADGRRSDGGEAAILMNVSGAIRGRVRTDGNIDLTVDASRGFTNAAATAGAGNKGRTMVTVRPGETIEVDTNLPIRTLETLGDLNQLFGKHRTAVRITARRLW